MQRRDIIIIQKVISELDIATDMLGERQFKAFIENEMLKRAICMTVVNVGELIKNVSEETRMKYKHIPWKAIAGMRDIAAHKYQTLRMEDVYQTVVTDFRELRKQLEKLVLEENKR